MAKLHTPDGLSPFPRTGGFLAAVASLAEPAMTWARAKVTIRSPAVAGPVAAASATTNTATTHRPTAVAGSVAMRAPVSVRWRASHGASSAAGIGLPR